MDDAGADLDAAGLESYLMAELGCDVAEIEVLADGLNLVLAISTPSEQPAYVLRRPNKLRDTYYIADLHREYEVLERLRETPIPAPVPVLFSDDESILGDPFFVTTHLPGETIPLGAGLPERFRDARSRERLAHRLVEMLAAVHSVDPEPFEGVCHHRTPREHVARAADRLDDSTSVTGHDLPRLRSVAAWLRRNAPTDPATTLVHGDFRPANVLFAGTDRPRIAAVLDWETAMLGDPLLELGYLLLRWRDDGDPTPSLDEIEARHGSGDAMRWLRDANQRGLAPFTGKPGSPTRQELVARYESRTGADFEKDRFYRAFAAFLLAVVWEDLHRHAVEAGVASDREPYVEYMGTLATGIVDGEFPL